MLHHHACKDKANGPFNLIPGEALFLAVIFLAKMNLTHPHRYCLCAACKTDRREGLLTATKDPDHTGLLKLFFTVE
jgi:hypothetical protein